MCFFLLSSVFQTNMLMVHIKFSSAFTFHIRNEWMTFFMSCQTLTITFCLQKAYLSNWKHPGYSPALYFPELVCLYRCVHVCWHRVKSLNRVFVLLWLARHCEEPPVHQTVWSSNLRQTWSTSSSRLFLSRLLLTPSRRPATSSRDLSPVVVCPLSSSCLFTLLLSLLLRSSGRPPISQHSTQALLAKRRMSRAGG